MTLNLNMFRFVRTTAMCAATLTATTALAPSALADPSDVDVSVSVPVGDQGSARIDSSARQYDDRSNRRPTWAERLNDNFYQVTDGERGARQAKREFDYMAQESPNAPLPKIGYALANLSLGRDADAVWAMRRAVQLDAAALYRVPNDYGLHDLVGRMSQRITQDVQNGRYNADKWFLLATLRVISGQEQAARNVLRYALDEGERSQATLALARHLGVSIPRYQNVYDKRLYSSNRLYIDLGYNRRSHRSIRYDYDRGHNRHGYKASRHRGNRYDYDHGSNVHTYRSDRYQPRHNNRQHRGNRYNNDHGSNQHRYKSRSHRGNRYNNDHGRNRHSNKANRHGRQSSRSHNRSRRH
jgi:hypothetical protein